jgi:hypothetical protein
VPVSNCARLQISLPNRIATDFGYCIHCASMRILITGVFGFGGGPLALGFDPDWLDLTLDS